MNIKLEENKKIIEKLIENLIEQTFQNIHAYETNYFYNKDILLYQKEILENMVKRELNILTKTIEKIK